MSPEANLATRRPRDPHQSVHHSHRATAGAVYHLPRRAEPPSRRLVDRPALVCRLASAAPPLAVLSAPAGYGKTALLTQWAQSDRRPFAWIALDDRANDPVRLAAFIAARLHRIEPLSGEVVRAIPPRGSEAGSARIERLLTALDRGRKPVVLVLENAQALRTPAALETVRVIADHLGPTSTVAIASRRAPPLPLGRLRAEGAVLELGLADLAMTAEEATELFRLAGLSPDPAEIATIVRSTEGWPAALQLAAKALRDGSHGSGAGSFAGDDRIVTDYVREEVLKDLNRHEQEVLRRCSLLEPLSGGLCDAALGSRGTGKVLRRLARSGVPLLPVDDCDDEYRLHRLVGKALRSELRRVEPHVEATIHARASVWFEESGDLERAIDEALAARDANRAATLLTAAAPTLALQSRVAALERWVQALDSSDLATHPALAVAAATSRIMRGDRDVAEHWTAAVEHTTPGARVPGLEAATLALRASTAHDGLAKMQQDATSAYNLAAQHSPWRAVACLLEGVALHLGDDAPRGRATLLEGARLAAGALPLVRLLCLAQLALLALDEPDLDEAVDLANRALADIDRTELRDVPASALAFAVSACTSARGGRVKDARSAATHAMRLRQTMSDPPPWYDAELRLALADAELRLSDAPAARALLVKASRAMRQLPESVVLQRWIDDAWARADAFAAGGVCGPETLTLAELRVLRFMPTHMSYREIGNRLQVSANTVKTQALAVYRKLDASSRSEAVGRAKALGLVEG